MLALMVVIFDNLFIIFIYMTSYTRQFICFSRFLRKIGILDMFLSLSILYEMYCIQVVYVIHFNFVLNN